MHQRHMGRPAAGPPTDPAPAVLISFDRSEIVDDLDRFVLPLLMMVARTVWNHRGVGDKEPQLKVHDSPR